MSIDKETHDYIKSESARLISEKISSESSKPLSSWKVSKGDYDVISGVNPTGIVSEWHTEASGIQSDIAKFGDSERAVFRGEVGRLSSSGEITHENLKSALLKAKSSKPVPQQATPAKSALYKFNDEVDKMERRG